MNVTTDLPTESVTEPPRLVTPRRVAYTGAWFVLVMGFLSVPMPYFTISPGAVIDVAELIEISGHETTPIQGSTALLAVTLRRPTIGELAWAKLDDASDVVPLARYLPQGQEDEEYFQDQELVFNDTFAVASTVALRAAGEDVIIQSSPVIAGILPGGPADGVLRPGDLILQVNGVAVATADDLVAEAGELQDGDEVRVLLLRQDEPVNVTFTAGQLPRMDRPGFGVTVDTAVREVLFPFDVRLHDDLHIGGPSAGLLFTLTVYDLVSEEDLIAGRRVTGTGTINPDGTIGSIGSIRQKVASAVREGYEIFLAPRAQADAAREAAADDLVVLGVRTFDEVLEALRSAPASTNA